ncbi:IPT/TIG domain-containing protein [bacterium]|nr:IPT/TIG domain-containing protein [bacterium]
MKTRRMPAAALMTLAALFLMTGCEYDGPRALYYETHPETVTPVITQMTPAEAAAGAQVLTLSGENFSQVPANNLVYINGYACEITSQSPASITIRRPDRYGDSCRVKIVNTEAIEFGLFEPYRIEQAYASFGGFPQATELLAMTVDRDENVYVFQKTPRTVYKVSPDGSKTELGTSSKAVTDAVPGPNGKIILLMNHANIQAMNPSDGSEELWVTVTNKKVQYGDFDANGCFYAGGAGTDLIVVRPDLSFAASGQYPRANIHAIRVYGGCVYVLAEDLTAGADPKIAVWKHAVTDAAGALGAKTLVLNRALTGAYADSTFHDIEFSAAGDLFVGTSHAHPVLKVAPDQSSDMYYKNLLPTAARQLVWGNGDFLYMLRAGGKWDLIRIDAGEPGAPHHGR